MGINLKKIKDLTSNIVVLITLLIIFVFVILYISYLTNGEIILLTLNMPYVWILPSLLLLFSIYKVSDIIKLIYNSKLNKNI